MTRAGITILGTLFLVSILIPLVPSGQIAQALATTGTLSCPSIGRPLSLGSRGVDVTQLQQFLISRDLLSGDSATGYFGSLTQAAVQSWQATNNIISYGTPTTTGYGIVGPKTRTTIAQACRNSTDTSMSETPNLTGTTVTEVNGVPTDVAPSCSTFSDLSRGDTDATTGGKVSELQLFLGITPTTGYYGSLTQAGYTNKCAATSTPSNSTDASQDISIAPDVPFTLYVGQSGQILYVSDDGEYTITLESVDPAHETANITVQYGCLECTISPYVPPQNLTLTLARSDPQNYYLDAITTTSATITLGSSPVSNNATTTQASSTPISTE